MRARSLSGVTEDGNGPPVPFDYTPLVTYDIMRELTESVMNNGAASSGLNRQSNSSKLAFSSERHFIEAIAGLLVRLPWNLTGVQILHGPREAGKDIVFTMQGGFGEPILCACVVKNTRITGSVDGSASALNILHQARQAFAIPFLGESGEEIPVQRIYVVTPYPLTTETKDSLRRQLPGDIQFIGGARLVDLFKAHWKDFLVDEFGARIRQLETLLDLDESLQKVSSAHHAGPIDKTVRDVYVSPTFCRTLSDFHISGRLTSLLDYSKLRRKMITNPRRTHSSDPLRIPATPDRWLLTPSDLEQRQTRLRQIQAAIAALSGLGMSPSYDQTLASIGTFLDSVDQLRKDVIQRALEKIHSDATSSTVSPIAEINTEQYERLLEQAAPLRDSLGEVAAEIQHQLQAVKSKAAAIAGTSRAFGDSAFVDSGRLERAVSLLNSDVIVRSGAHQFEFSADLIDSINVILITAPAGYGKTSFCRWHALEDIRRYNSGESHILPVYVLLHRLAEEQLTDFKSAFLSNPTHSLLVSKESSTAPEDQTLRFYLDGLDEVASARMRSQIVALVRQAAEDPKVRIILTARDYVVNPEMHWMPYVSLGELSRERSSELIDKWLTAEQAHTFRSQAAYTQGIEALLRTPLLATLTLLVFRQTGNLPASKVRLYETFLDLMISGWDLAKGVNRGSRLSARIKWAIVRRIAWVAQENRSRELTTELISAEIATFPALDDIGSRATIEELLSDGLISGSGGVYQFPHLSFQEYLAAKDLLGDPRGRRLNQALDRFLKGDDWWREVLSFYIGMTGSAGDVRAWLNRGIRKTKGEAPGWLVEGRAEEIRDIVENALGDLG